MPEIDSRPLRIFIAHGKAPAVESQCKPRRRAGVLLECQPEIDLRRTGEPGLVQAALDEAVQDALAVEPQRRGIKGLYGSVAEM